ncbi:hypothetical protein [Methyloceanibacter sp.]|nr:hypothetical protein [Methyloceanibacter sp.]HML91216.1 hypothetical protein [Methyloceanibacter sp.]
MTSSSRLCTPEAGPFSKAVMGDVMFEVYAAFRREEWDSYHNHIPD